MYGHAGAQTGINVLKLLFLNLKGDLESKKSLSSKFFLYDNFRLGYNSRDSLLCIVECSVLAFYSWFVA